MGTLKKMVQPRILEARNEELRATKRNQISTKSRKKLTLIQKHAQTRNKNYLKPSKKYREINPNKLGSAKPKSPAKPLKKTKIRNDKTDDLKHQLCTLTS